MTISYSWLKDYIECDLSAQQIADTLTSIGLEVDSLETVEQIPGGLKGVIVAEVVECVPHPDSDHLHVTKVNLGDCPEKEANSANLSSDGLLQVVCGAPNVAAGQKVLLATTGTCLGEDFKIKKSKIRGVESFGMLCAEDELGIGDSHEGIMVLDPSAVPGTPAKEYLGLQDSSVIEIGLTANRVDAASHMGVARDLYAKLRHEGIPCKLNLPDVSAFREGTGKCPLGIEVLAKDGAPRYSGIYLTGVKVGPSPDWLQDRLKSVGLRPINNVVDIANFVLMETGQPLHTFDADKIGGGKVIVRRASEGEHLTTLDGVDRTLSSKDLVIADSSKPMCIAGVFGGQDSGTTEATVNVFLESAYFAPASIRKTSKRHTLKTDASFRYERGADPLVTVWAAKRAALLLQEYAGATVVGPVQDVYETKPERKTVELDYGRIASFVGKDLGRETIENILKYLGYEFLQTSQNGSTVSVPSYMIDVYRECDVVEEILRIYGYNNIELPTSIHSSVNPSLHPEPEAVRNAISDFLASNGYNEIMNNSLTGAEYYAGLTTFPQERCVKVMNPLSSDLNVMRQSLVPGGLEVVAYNINRQCNHMRLFEFGNVYSLREPGIVPTTLSSVEEHQALCIMITGSDDKNWNTIPAKGGFFALKGCLELLLRRIGADLAQMESDAAPSDIFAEGLRYSLPGGGGVLATMGTVSQSFAKKFGIRQAVYAAEISWPVFFKLVKRNKVKYSEVPKFPEVRRDLALLLDEEVRYEDMRRIALKVGRKLVKNVGLFDVYRGDKIAFGKKQYALSFVLQDSEKTLTDNDSERVMDSILQAFRKEFGAEIR